MPGLGTIINVAAIVIGGVFGLLFGSRLPERARTTLLVTNGVAVMFIGMAGAFTGMFQVQGETVSAGHTMLIIASLIVGALIGSLADLDKQVTRFGEWLKAKTGNASDKQFVEGFVTASMTVSIGAMAVMGAINDALLGDISILVTKAILDLVIIMAMTCSMGKGCIFSAISVAVVQGTCTIFALAIGAWMTDAALANIGLVGSILIFCVGVNLVWGDKIKVLNMLPAVIIAPALAYLPFVL